MHGMSPIRYIAIAGSASVLVHTPEKRKTSLACDEAFVLGSYYNAPRECTWRSKDIDFTEALGAEALDAIKQVVSVKLYYQDLSKDVVTSMKVSVDGGQTWCVKTAAIGDGDGTTKYHVFDYAPDDKVTGSVFTFEIQCLDYDTDFKWLGLEVDLIVRGEDFPGE